MGQAGPQDQTQTSEAVARRTFLALNEKIIKLEADMETQQRTLEAREKDIREANAKIQTLTKSSEARDAESRNLHAVLDGVDLQQLRQVKEFLYQVVEESEATRQELNVARASLAEEREAKRSVEATLKAARAKIPDPARLEHAKYDGLAGIVHAGCQKIERSDKAARSFLARWRITIWLVLLFLLGIPMVKYMGAANLPSFGPEKKVYLIPSGDWFICSYGIDSEGWVDWCFYDYTDYLRELISMGWGWVDHVGG